MPILHAIVLGLVQGLSEFLPISSSGHLLLVPWLFGWNDLTDESTKKAFDVALHIGTIVAAVAYFRADLARYIGAGVGARRRGNQPMSTDARVAWLLLASTVPAALVGAAFEEWIDEQLGTPLIIAISLIVFGLLLSVADRALGTRPIERYGWRDAFTVGAAQALALNPGTSRSGITITASRLQGFSRDAAARISFLMMLPVTVGAVILKVGGMIADGVPRDLYAPMVVGIVTSAISGWVAVWGTLRLVRTKTFTPFVIYRLALGVFVLVVLAAGWRS